MSKFEPPAIALPVLRTIVVPVTLYESAMRANMSVVDLTVFSNLRKIASLEEIGVFALINDTTAINNCPLATTSLRSMMTLGSGNAIEMDSVFSRIMNLPEVRQMAVCALQRQNDPFTELLHVKHAAGAAVTLTDTKQASVQQAMNQLVGDLPYQLKTSGSNVFVVVGGGFDKYVGASQSKDQSNEFVRSFLKVCNEFFRPSEVARHPLFKSFLRTLAE